MAAPTETLSSGLTPKASANVLLERYLFHCCLYYQFNTSVLTDTEFDALAHALRDRWSEVDCEHKKFVDIEALKKSTSGFYIKYPTIVREVAKMIDKTLPK